MSNLEEFKALGLSEEILSAISAKGFETPSPIQRLTIPVLLDSENDQRDIIAQAQTGTGKTAAFGLPILERLRPSKTGAQALILTPTRELALQVTEELLSFNSHKLSIAPIYGGASMSEQLRRLQKGIDIVVGTPGRILDHIRRGTLDLSQVCYLILDEADEMLNMGFIEDIEAIMAAVDERRRVLLFSATMPTRIVALSKKYMRNVQMLRVESPQLTVDLTDQIYFEVREGDKFDALTRIIDVEPEFYGIVFSRTKVGVDEMVNRLLERGYAAEGLHGDVSQAQREKTLRRFKKKQVNILVATDVAARGIDVNNLSHVINYSLPQDSESYVHRIGRTGRAGNQGTAITFISPSETRGFGFLKRDIKADITKATLPTAQDVIATKRSRVKDELNEIIENGNYEEYMEMASELIAGHPAPVAMSALLRMAFKNDLSETNYPEIRSINVDRRGKARLFIAIGRLDGYDARKMVDLLKRECGLNDSKIDEVHLKDAYSFVTVPFADAEQTVRKLNAIRKGDRPLAEISQDGAGGERSPKAPRDKKPSHKKEFRSDEPFGAERPRFDKKPRKAGYSDENAKPSASKGAFYEGWEEFEKKPRAPKSAASEPIRADKPVARPQRKTEYDDYKPSKKAGGTLDESRQQAQPAAWDSEFETNPAPKRVSKAKSASKPAPETVVSEQRTPVGFDWAAFEAALPGNWEDRPGKAKKAKTATAPAKPKEKPAKKVTAKIRSKR